VISEQDVRQAFTGQAAICSQLGSNFMQHLCLGLAGHLDKSTQTGKRVLEWQGNPHPKGDALALRLAGGLHAIIRRNPHFELAQFYKKPENARHPDFIKYVLGFIRQNDEELVTWLDNAPQTNEVARSSIIFAGLSVISEKYHMPLSLYELGASGGLNLQCAEFAYQFDGKEFGNRTATLKLEPDWEGHTPPEDAVSVVTRRGCDLNPLSVTNDQDCEKLIAYLWPDQPGRIERVLAAVEIARHSPPRLDKADAADWVETVFTKSLVKGKVAVLYHTIAQNYFPRPVIKRIEAAIKMISNEATSETPLAWLSFEFEDRDDPQLRLRTWPDEKDLILASADPHVYGVRWH